MATRIKEGMTGAEVAQIIDEGFDNLDEIRQNVESNTSQIETITHNPFVFELMGIGTTKEEVNINYKGKSQGSSSEEEFQRTIPSASALNAGVMTAADKVRLDNTCTVFMLDVDHFEVGETYEGELTSEEVSLLVDTYTKGGIVALWVDEKTTLYSDAINITDGIITITFSYSNFSYDSNLTTLKIVLSIALDFKYTINSNIYEIRKSGDGMQFLSDDGTYKTIDLSSLDDTYLPLTGGTLTGGLNITGDNSLAIESNGAADISIYNDTHATSIEPGVITIADTNAERTQFVLGGILIAGKTSSDLLHADGGTTTLKTINGQSLLGSGDITIEQSGSEDNSIVDVSSIVQQIMDENTITPEDYNSLKEYITQGKTLLFVEGQNVTTLYSFLSNNVITIGYYALSPDDDKVTSVYISIDSEQQINPYTLTFPSTKIIPQVLLTDYISGSTYSTINSEDSINSAIGKLEAGIKSLTTNSYGDTESRPSDNITVGYKYFDTTLNKPIWWNGTKWVDYNGNDADVKTSGTTAQRPSDVITGFQYFDTDINSPVYWNGIEWIKPATDTGVKVVKITQTEYDSLEPKDPNTLYAIISDSTIQ